MDWNRIGRTIAEAGRSAADAVSDTADKVKMKGKIYNDEGKLQDAYAAIGRYYYEHQEAELAPEIASKFEEVKSLLTLIEEEKAALNKAEEKTICPACGAENGKEDIYCRKCGVKLTKENEE